MERKSFKYKLLDNVEYTFCERNVEDVDLSHLQNKIRTENIKFIQDNVRDGDHQFALMRVEMTNYYSDTEIGRYVSTHSEERALLLYHSFKVENNIPFEDFRKKINDGLIAKLLTMVHELESDEDINEDDIAKSLGVKIDLVRKWRDEQPKVYNALKKSVKKNILKESVKK